MLWVYEVHRKEIPFKILFGKVVFYLDKVGMSEGKGLKCLTEPPLPPPLPSPMLGATNTVCNVLITWLVEPGNKKNERQNNAPNPKKNNINAAAGYKGSVKLDCF